LLSCSHLLISFSAFEQITELINEWRSPTMHIRTTSIWRSTSWLRVTTRGKRAAKAGVINSDLFLTLSFGFSTALIFSVHLSCSWLLHEIKPISPQIICTIDLTLTFKTFRCEITHYVGPCRSCQSPSERQKAKSKKTRLFVFCLFRWNSTRRTPVWVPIAIVYAHREPRFKFSSICYLHSACSLTSFITLLTLD